MAMVLFILLWLAFTACVVVENNRKNIKLDKIVLWVSYSIVLIASVIVFFIWR